MRARYTAQAIANFFLWQEQITQMKLHKLLYYAAGWHLGFTGEPLFDEDIEAWQYGPVVPSIYLVPATKPPKIRSSLKICADLWTHWGHRSAEFLP